MANRGRNEGTIYRKSNGKWRAQISLDGRRMSFAAGTRAECHDWLRKMLDQVDRGMTFDSRNLTLAEYLKEWMTGKKNELRARTSFQYQRLITMYIEPKLGRNRLKDLSLRSVIHFYEDLASRGIGVSHIRYCHRVLHSALEQAARSGAIWRNPAHGATVPKPAHREMQILNDQQVGLFLMAAEGSRYKALYYLAVTTGMRISELRGLRWTDVDWIRGTITINRQIQDIPGKGALSGAPKTRAGTRQIRLGETVLDTLKTQQLRNDGDRTRAGSQWRTNDLIFPSKTGSPFVSISLHKDFHAVLAQANLPRMRFHDLRHTAASLMLSHGVSALVVSKILGHSNPSITLSVYAHSTLDMQEGAAVAMDELIAPIPVSVAQLHPSAPDQKK